MAKNNISYSIHNEYQKSAIKILNSITGKFNAMEIWRDFITLCAISISNSTDGEHVKRREEEYYSVAGKYEKSELDKMAESFAYVIEGLENNSNQDFLGDLYMAMEFGNRSGGQFFTPYNLCALMTEMEGLDAVRMEIGKTGFARVADPACGAGATLISFANECKKNDINYQTSVLFVGQDIDNITGKMCYIQLSLLGCSGYVAIADTLSHPITSYDNRGLLPDDSNIDVWYTPMFFRDIWKHRRSIEMIKFAERIRKSENAKNRSKSRCLKCE